MFLLSRTRSCYWVGARIRDGWTAIYVLPGGHIEVGETPKVAAIREMKEELGVLLKPKDLEFFSAVARNTSEGESVAYEFAIRDKDYEFRNAEPEKCSELLWVDLDALPDDVIDEFAQIIKQGLLGGKMYLEMGY
jgi:8-oxo-dGTP diphosphatase